jgi:hypothetical protein
MGTPAHGGAADWPKDRIERLTTPDVLQLRANAERLNEPEVAALCDQVLGARPRSGGARSRKPTPKTRKAT